MNINKVKSFFSIWKPIKSFYSFNELIEQYDNLYVNDVNIFPYNLRYYFATDKKIILDFSFNKESTYNDKTHNFKPVFRVTFNGLIFRDNLRYNNYLPYKFGNGEGQLIFKYDFKKALMNILTLDGEALNVYGNITKFADFRDINDFLISTLAM